MVATQTRRNPLVLDDSKRWTQREFLKEKLRVRERYWRPVSEAAPPLATSLLEGTNDGESYCWIIPDGIAWRKFLPLLSHLVENSSCKLVLLESAVDLMDYRNMSPCISVVSSNYDDQERMFPESAAPQERSKIQKLLQNPSNCVIPYCDLSVREQDYDEFDMMGYAKMSISERSQHALLRAGRIIQQQAAASSKILILSTDPGFVAKFPSEDGIELTLIDKLIHSLIERGIVFNADKILELKGRSEENYRLRNTPSTMASASTKSFEHLSEEKILEGLKNKTLVKGRLNVTKENPKEAFVVVSNGDSHFVNGQLGHFNRSLHHDIVILQPLPPSEWGRPIGKRRLVHHRDDDDDNNQQGIETDTTPPVPSARVVAIVEVSQRQFVATMVDAPMNDESACLVIPMDIRIPKIRLRTSGWRRFLGNRLLVQINAWEIGSNYPSGHCVEILGPVADLETEIKCLLHENGIDVLPFSAAAMAMLPPEGNEWKVPPEEIQNRLDLRSSHRIFSVDPPGCQDIDDTMHARVLPNGDIEVGVHIADVTHFVPHNSPLDLEAQTRGTTFYLVDRRFDMLPSLLSSDLCSLHGNTDRLAISTIWTMSQDFKEIKSFWYGRTVIHNCQAMTYEQAHNIIHDKPPDDGKKKNTPPLTAGAPVDPSSIGALKNDLEILSRLARKLRKDREEIGGAVDLSSGDQGSELKFTLDENNNPTQVAPKKQLEIHQTIAEMMILANEWVAKTIYQNEPDSALLRIHQSVDGSRFEDLKEVLKAGKINFDGSNNMALANSLKKAENTTKSGTLMSLFQSLATRAMSEAQYVCTGQFGESSLSHYGLGLQKYCHFTSPIRRYADVVVHKQLLAAAATAAVTTKESISFPRRVERKGLEVLPASSAISILHGEGLVEEPKRGIVTDDEESEALFTPIQHSKNTSLSRSQLQAHSHSTEKITLAKYKASEVTSICKGLNQQNRRAKLSSFECQSLFLSLYFKSQSETTQAVVTNLRANGFWVYVPQFDIRGPVYLCDASGNVQIDPLLLKLDPSAGQPPTIGFSGSGSARMFASGRCSLINSPDEHLEVVVSEFKSSYVVRVLDVVTVKICCDNWDTRARVPLPRLHLIGASSAMKKAANEKRQPTKSEITSSTLASPAIEIRNFGAKRKVQVARSIYDETLSLYTPPVLSDVPYRTREKRNESEGRATATMAGRIIYGGFRNPDTQQAKQEVLIAEASDAAQQRRNQAIANMTRNNEFNTTQSIEKDATARMQRLVASKRNTRKAKGK